MTLLFAFLLGLAGDGGARRIVVAPGGEVTTVAAALRLAQAGDTVVVTAGVYHEPQLRVTVPVFVAERVLPRVVERFARAHPVASLDLHASDDLRDLVKEGFDLAVRLGPLPDSALRGRRVVSFRRVVVAAPAFVRERGAPRHPRQLAALPGLLYGSGAGRVTWSFRRRSGARARVEVSGPVRSSNLELLAALAHASAGLVHQALGQPLGQGEARPVERHQLERLAVAADLDQVSGKHCAPVAARWCRSRRCRQ